MLLVADIGNSNIVVGVYEGAQLRASWRLTSRLNATVDEYVVMLGTLLDRAQLHSSPSGSPIEACAIASVVPPLTGKFCDVLTRLGAPAPLIVGPGVKTGLDIK